MPIAIALAHAHPDRHAPTGASNAASAADGVSFSALLRSSAASETDASAAPMVVAEPPGQALADDAVATDPAASANLAYGTADTRAAALASAIEAAQPLHADAAPAAPAQPAAHGGRDRAASPEPAPRVTASPARPPSRDRAAQTVAAPRDAKAPNLRTLPPVAPADAKASNLRNLPAVAPADEPGSGGATADPPPAPAAIDPVVVNAGQVLIVAAALPQRLDVADTAPEHAGPAPAAVATAPNRSRPRAANGQTPTRASAGQRPGAAAAGTAIAAAAGRHASAPAAAPQLMKATPTAAGPARADPTVAAQSDDAAVAGAAIAAADADARPASAAVAAPQPTRSRAAAGHTEAKASVAAPRDHGTAVAAVDARPAPAPAAGARASSRPIAAPGDARAAAAVDSSRPGAAVGGAAIAAAATNRNPDPTAHASGARPAEDAAAPPDAAAQAAATMMTMPMQPGGDEDPPADAARTAGMRRLGAEWPNAAGNAREATPTGDGQRGAKAGAGVPVTAAADPPPRAIAIDVPAPRSAAAAAQRPPTEAAGAATEPVRERVAFGPGAPTEATPTPPPPMVAGAAEMQPAEKTAATSAERSPVREAHIAAAVGDPGFAPAVGATLAVLTREGVHQARLQLHPAEMGPITVQIALDGQSARVDFHAAVAATRQALESALPALAGALRESGLTLTGGGVFQQSPGRQGGDAQPGDWGRAAQDRVVDALPAAPTRTIARRGLVDLVA